MSPRPPKEKRGGIPIPLPPHPLETAQRGRIVIPPLWKPHLGDEGRGLRPSPFGNQPP
uniref:Uncharacterized protein n=1 Tax=Siphoviridae sp. ctoiW10 TaxID=2827592 RepID=A0A8S5LPA3_9CAUD|nr:MAG TPA: hypothetical protein [Siphoviridae sp. ctoiW10]